MPTIRPYRATDLADLRHVCVVTAAAGKDSTGRTQLPDLVSDIFAVPYTVHDPEFCFVVDDGERVVGYIVGCGDTPAFATWFRDEWVPEVAGKYPAWADMPRSWDRFMVYVLHHSYDRMAVPDVAGYPSHLHLDLVPEYQRKGLGGELMATYLAALRAGGVPAVHVCVAAKNVEGLAFYTKWGFRALDVPEEAPLVWLGRSTAE
jgi:ribosomal protein S18 acetylase RimI-like enzyme